MSISYHDPRGRSRVASEPYTCKSALDGNAVIGLLANGFPDSVAFLDAIERTLADALPAAQFARYAKPSASVPATHQLIATIASACDAVVTAYGH